jgi:hypothetical protein
MQAATLLTGYRLIDRNKPGVAAALNEDIRLIQRVKVSPPRSN